jgi:hypothetical protein
MLMAENKYGEKTEIFFSGEIKDGKIYDLTATDNRGGKYEVAITLVQTNPKSPEDRICWDCGMEKDRDERRVMDCVQVPCGTFESVK